MGTVEMNVVGTTVALTKETRVVLVVDHHAPTKEETVRRVVACSVHRDDKMKEEMKEESRWASLQYLDPSHVHPRVSSNASTRRWRLTVGRTHPRIQEHRKEDGGSNILSEKNEVIF